MSKDNEFEIIDDFDDFGLDSPANNEVEPVPSVTENNNIEVEIPSFSFGDFETSVVKKEETKEEVPPANLENNTEPVTFEFDGFEGALIEDKTEVQNVVQPETQTEVKNEIPNEVQVEVKQEPKIEETLPTNPELAMPGTLNVMGSTPTLNMNNKEDDSVEINPVLPNGEPVVSKEVKNKEEKSKEKENYGTKIAFIIILFAVIGAVIIFLPQISEMLSK